MHLWRHPTFAGLAGLLFGLCPVDSALTWACWPLGLVLLAHSIAPKAWINLLSGTICGLLWHGVSTRWFPGLWASFGAQGDPWLAYAGLVAAQAVPTIIGLVTAGWLHRSLPLPVALGMGLGIAEALLPWVQPLPSGLAIYTSHMAPLLWPAALGGVVLYAAWLGVWAGTVPRHPGVALVMAAGTLMVGALWTYSVVSDDVTIAVVQPNTGPFDARRSSTSTARRDKLTRLIREAGRRGARAVFTPEGAWPDDIGVPGSGVRTTALNHMASMPPTLLGAMGGSNQLPYNSLLVVQDQAVVGTYHKLDLVPLGERELLGFGQDTVRPGTQSETLTIAGLRVAPMICYEDLHRHNLALHSDLVVSATNDGWLGRGPGADTHLAAAKVTAIVGGRTLIRPALNGRSAVIDRAGTVLWQAPWIDGDESPDHPGFIGVVRVETRQPIWWGARATPWLYALLLSGLVWSARRSWTHRHAGRRQERA